VLLGEAGTSQPRLSSGGLNWKLGGDASAWFQRDFFHCCIKAKKVADPKFAK
jgi:hypothetical protein